MDVSLYKQFYESIGFAPYIEVRMFGKNGWIFSEYAESYNDIIKIMKKNKEHNCYIGINPRKNKGRKNTDVAYRRTIIFDVEMNGEKLPLSDRQYQINLNETIFHIQKYMKKTLNFEWSWIIKSGRGLHLYYLIEPLDMEFQPEYNKFYTSIMNELNSTLKIPVMKIDFMLKDAPRIIGAPGTHNKKYKEETAFREIILKNEHPKQSLKNTMIAIRKKRPKYTQKKDNTVKGDLLTVKTIKKKPEFKIFKYDNLPKGSINNKLRLALKLLMKQHRFTPVMCDEIATTIAELGRPYKPMYLDEVYKEYNYSKQILNHWCIDNYKWCVENDFKLPYPINYIKDTNGFYSDEIIEYNGPEFKLKTFEDVKQYTLMFNKSTRKITNKGTVYYHKTLEKKLQRYCDPFLLRFIQVNNLFVKIKNICNIKKYNSLNNIEEYIEP